MKTKTEGWKHMMEGTTAVQIAVSARTVSLHGWRFSSAEVNVWKAQGSTQAAAFLHTRT